MKVTIVQRENSFSVVYAGVNSMGCFPVENREQLPGRVNSLMTEDESERALSVEYDGSVREDSREYFERFFE